MIAFEKIHKAYNRRPVVTDICFEVPPGSCMVLYGPSGCGKTTLLRLAAGFERPDQGTIHINHHPASTPKHLVKPYERSIGMVFQDLALWPHMSVKQHLSFAIDGAAKSTRKHQKIIAATLEQVGLEVDQDAYPHQLSGGEKQRLALARALIGHPDLLLMDEPLCSLDTMLRSTILRRIKSIITSTGTTTLYVTHDLQEALYVGDLLAVMEKGRIRSIKPVETRQLNRIKANELGTMEAESDQTPRLERADQ